MKITNPIDELFSTLRPYFQRDSITRKDVNEKPPLRSELFSTEQMDHHAQYLASVHSITHDQSPEQLLKRLSDNEEILFKVNELLQSSVKEKKSISPAGEWLLDNFYLIEEQIRVGKRYLPKGYSKGLPKLTKGPLAGYPRVYDLAIEIISHSDGHVDIASLSNFIAAYQKGSHLTLGELWAIPIMIRLALLENLGRVAARIAIDRIDAALANKWAKDIIDVAEKNPKDLVLILADMVRAKPPMVSAFVAEFARKLQWKGPELSLPLNWVEQHLSDTDHTINSMVLAENQKQAADQVSVSNSINSLRFLTKIDWREFVETMSVVEQTLRTDIDGTYAKMDFYTRDQYRHEVEKIAKSSNLAENDIAQIAINLAKENYDVNPNDKRRSHVGYFLIDKGLKKTEQIAGMKLKPGEALRKFIRNHSYALYVIVALLFTLSISGGMLLELYAYNTSIKLLVAVFVLSIICASHLAIALTNWLVTLWIKPKPLPKLNFAARIPNEYRTMVTIPTLIASPAQVEKLMEDLEVRFLANRDPNLLFALLTDFRDAASETMPDDSALVDLASARISELNKQYANGGSDIFYLFHRPRRWNAVDKVWMGYERKRGKLSELNHVLRGASPERFAVIIGDARVYTTVKYIITLDTDTQLPRDAGWKLIGLMAHPLNQPAYDEEKKRVTEGYAIIQPRIAISLHGATRSGYTRLHENDAGIDPYTRVTSDVYQDVFHEGSFIGKGIYDIDAFEKALNNRFPENRILSHDLLEGSYTRCGFASDVQFYEDYPSRYSTDISRRHRWIRGDWQIGNWFLPFVPGSDKRYRKNSISALSRWKIFDNLRRSIVPIALLSLLIAGWTILPHAWFWTACVTAIIIFPSILLSTINIIRKPKEINFEQHFSNAIGTTHKNIFQAIFTIICLPYEAYISVDAIVRTLWRMYISGKNLLEWNPSGFVNKTKESLADNYRSMWISPVLALIVAGYLLERTSPIFFIAIPFIVLWLLSPVLVTWLSKPMSSSKTKLKEDQKIHLRELARKTWSFFENFVGEEDNWLPPDNLQQYPVPVVAHRTSPTNIGLSLLANLAACDFGYATTSQLIDRTVNTFSTLDKLERHKGHFFNWYDTRSLQVLHPKYISTVDSGNLAGHLLTLRQGFLAIPDQKIIDSNFWSGLQDTLRIAIKGAPEYETALFELHNKVPASNFTLYEAKEFLDNLLVQYNSLIAGVQIDPANDAAWWMQAAEKQIRLFQQELQAFAPWIVRGPLPEKFKNWEAITKIPTLKQLSEIENKLTKEINDFLSEDLDASERQWLLEIRQSLAEATKLAHVRIFTLQRLAAQCYAFADMEYDFLYDRAQHLLTIGYNADEHHCDNSFYDLLASEARLSSFVAIAQGKIPQDNWFALGRRLTTAGNTPVLLSWSGSMFEYLMPSLVMPVYENTLLDEMEIGTVKKQIEYGEQLGIPWGISESCYNVVDAHLTYQYRAFGIPGLGFKRGLGQDMVIAPYATVLALMVDPQAACRNLERMRGRGFEGRYGFYEAIDFTPERLSRGQSHAVIQTFMAHHQGMGLLALANTLLDKPMHKRFEADTQFQTALLLLQEQVPKTTGYYLGSSDDESLIPSLSLSNTEIRVIKTLDTLVPEVQLLSNGRYHVMLSQAGGGYNRWKELAVTRWREDTTCDNWGMFCYIRDLDNKTFWSAAHQPTLKEADHYEAIFSQGRVEFRRRDQEIETYTEIIVSPEDDIEVRRIHLTNHSKTKRHLAIASYGEVVLAAPASDNAHPAFSNLFVQTEIKKHQHAIACTRRARSKDERPPWMFHLMKVVGTEAKEVSYETDRNKFIGRGQSIMHPTVMNSDQPLSGSQGSVLDPIVSIQSKITLAAGETAIIDVITGITDNQDTNQGLIDKYQDRHLRDRAFELSWTHSQVVLRQIGATEADAQLYARMASSILYVNPLLRANGNVILKNQRGQSALWTYSISGDLPIVLLQVSDSSNMTLVRQLIKAQAYWQLKGLSVDLVILNEDASGYRQVLQDQIQGLVAAGIGTNTSERPGRIFVRPLDQILMEDFVLLQTVARIIISDKKGTLSDQINKRIPPKVAIPKFIPSKTHAISSEIISPQKDLQFFNGIGGFSSDGKEYIITTNEHERTPLPWINVIANKNFGTVLSETGSSYTWYENAHEFRLTPWHNDPVSDKTGETFYLRDEEGGQFWSPIPQGSLESKQYVTRHGFGYSIFECQENGIHSNVSMHVDLDSSIKFITIQLKNASDRIRKISVTGYVEWVLGGLRSKSNMHIVTELDITTGAIISKNAYNTEFQSNVGFFAIDQTNYQYTTDRTEFIGRNGTLKNPAAMSRSMLSGKSGAGYDACAALQTHIEIESGRERTITFMLGAGKNKADAVQTMKRFQGSPAVAASLEKVKIFWNHTLSAIQLETPDPAINILANGWLVYQVLSCRLWGRSGFYQSGGAYGFRDQLQDVIALLHAQPHLTREQILLCASRQFKEGDVQHWWHPPLGRGVRTLCSDDYLWLPYVTSRYIETTGDTLILDETIHYLQGRQLNAKEESYYDMPIVTDQKATLYDHCKQAIEHGFRYGERGLPLMGAGDWNDGMNMVGIHGKGESVWLAFFLYEVLQRFIETAKLRGDDDFIKKCDQEAKALKKNINLHAWDGSWYRRAYFDDGTPLGSASNEECKIDAIAQSWSVLSNAGEPERSLLAMQSVNEHLINREKGLIQLLEPPFDKADLDPGYIKGYVPGVRENGGQYTHAAIWMVMAFAKLKDLDRTSELINLINPINHAKTKEDAMLYKAEPYVMAADVYGVEPHTGRGGWTWYTGSAGWMYQLIIESFIGLKRTGDTITFNPCVPEQWKSFTVKYRFDETLYTINVEQHERETLLIDGIEQNGKILKLINDKNEHQITLRYILTRVKHDVTLPVTN